MLKVLIADDELNICKLIKKLINWDELDLELLDMCSDSREALDIILTKAPDIVITDIRMPGMTGLELIKRTIDEGIDVRFIIISGYTHFDYARTAMKYGVEDFLLKPINKDEINSVLQRLVDKIGQNYTGKRAAKPADGAVRQEEKRRRREFVSMVAGNAFEVEELSLDELNRERGFSFKDGCFRTGIMHIDYKDVTEEYRENIRTQFENGMLSEMSKKCYDVESCISRKDLFFIINYAKDAEDMVVHSLENVLNEMLGIISSYDFIKITVGVGKSCVGIDNISSSVFSAECAVNSRIILGTNRMILADELDLNPEDDMSEAVLKRYYDKLRGMMEIMDAGHAVSLTREFCEDNEQMIKKYPYAVIDWIKSMTHNIILMLNSENGIDEDISRKYALTCGEYEVCSTYDELIDCFINAVGEIFLIFMRRGEEDVKKLDTAKKYIAMNYNKHIQLEDVARQVYLNPAYFGIFFKKETGVNFSEYLTGVRMDAAKEMLKDKKLSIADIAGHVGYKDTRYFSKMFKKHTGIKPSEYRKIYGE